MTVLLTSFPPKVTSSMNTLTSDCANAYSAEAYAAVHARLDQALADARTSRLVAFALAARLAEVDAERRHLAGYDRVAHELQRLLDTHRCAAPVRHAAAPARRAAVARTCRGLRTRTAGLLRTRPRCPWRPGAGAAAHRSAP